MVRERGQLEAQSSRSKWRLIQTISRASSPERCEVERIRIHLHLGLVLSPCYKTGPLAGPGRPHSLIKSRLSIGSVNYTFLHPLLHPPPHTHTHAPPHPTTNTVCSNNIISRASLTSRAADGAVELTFNHCSVGKRTHANTIYLAAINMKSH